MESAQINLMEVGTKAQSKAELYRLLTLEGGMYLPPEDQTNMEFISDIAFKVREALYVDGVKMCQVPHIDGLRSSDFIKFIVEDCQGEIYLPRNYADYIPNRAWLANICNTLDNKKFQSMIYDALRYRENNLLKKRNLSLDVDPRFASIIQTSTMVAVNKGKSHLLLRKKLHRDKKEQLDLINKQKDEELKSIDPLKDEINLLKRELKEKEKEIAELEENREILGSLYEKGLIDAQGNILK